MAAPKYNPFRPNDTVHLAMFVGRLDEIRGAELCLFQTKNGNPQHFLVEGERGIGKSSLLMCFNLVARGRIKTLTGVSLNFLSIPIDLGTCETKHDLIRKLGRGFRQAISGQQGLKERAKDVWDWITNWEILGVQYHKEDKDIDLEEVVEEFVEHLAAFCDKTKDELDGILFLIDEADHPPIEAALGTYLKLICERLGWKECRRVVFGLSGLPSLLSKLRESHESSPRLFQTMHLGPLLIDERKRAVRIGLNEANKTNADQTTIDDDALDFLAELSEGYPHFVQQFSWSAFDHDQDHVIDEDDVGDGAFKDGGALSQLGDKFFSEMYHARISSEEYRRVLDAMADHGDDWVARRQIIKESGISETNVTNALATLKAKSVIIQDETRRGFYKLPTRSFAAWINAIRAARAKSDVQRKDQP